MDPEPPCRACTDFKSWTKTQKKKYDNKMETDAKKSNDSTNMTTPTSSNREKLNCPLDKAELGKSTWSFLHTMAAYYPDKPSVEQKKDMSTFFHIFSKFYPCSICAEDLREQIQVTPPKTSSQNELSQWLCMIHNEVNKKLGKSEFDCKLVNQRWRDGWLDGSCD